MTKRSFDLTSAEAADQYRLLSGIVVPRPIGWIGTRRPDGTFNLAPFSFFNLVSSSPPVVMFSGGNHADRPKDSVAFAIESGEFTVNSVSVGLTAAMSVTSGSFGSGEDEFSIAGLTPVAGTKVDAPLVVESPANLECRVVDMVELGDPPAARVVFGEVVMIHVAEDALEGTRIRPDVLDVVGRMVGSSYVTTRDRFEVDRPG